MTTKIRSLSFLLIAILVYSVTQVALGLGDIPYFYADETTYVNAAQANYEFGETANWEHPPLGKFFIYIGRSISEDGVFGARLFSFVFYLLSLGILYLIGNQVLHSRLWSLGLITFVSLDPLTSNFAKLAYLDMYALFFVLLGLFTFLRLQSTEEKNGGVRNRYFILFTAAFGLGMGTKWIVFPIFLTLSIWLLVSAFKEHKHVSNPYKYILVGALLTVIFYISSYLPMIIALKKAINLAEFINLHANMIQFHTHYSVENYNASPWWSWPIMLKPVWLLLKFEGENIKGILAVPNSLLNFLGWLSLLYALYNFNAPRSRISKVITLVVLMYFAFFAVLGRESTYSFYYLLMIPFLYLNLVFVISNFRNERNFQALAFVIVAAFTNLLFLQPIIRNQEMSLQYFESISLWKSWSYPWINSN